MEHLNMGEDPDAIKPPAMAPSPPLDMQAETGEAIPEATPDTEEVPNLPQAVPLHAMYDGYSSKDSADTGKDAPNVQEQNDAVPAKDIGDTDEKSEAVLIEPNDDPRNVQSPEPATVNNAAPEDKDGTRDDGEPETEAEDQPHAVGTPEEQPAKPQPEPDQAPDAQPTLLMYVDPEKTLTAETKGARERLVTGVDESVADIAAYARSHDTTPRGIPIVEGTGQEEVDRVKTGFNTEMVATKYGGPGLYVGEENGQPVPPY